MQSRKHTAWKKSRTFGDVFGGRRWAKVADNILARSHSLKRPGPGAELPIFLTDNPSRDFFFPVTIDEIRATLALVREPSRALLTHVWLRRVSRRDWERGTRPWASFLSGSGVRAIVLHAWPRSLLVELGGRRPSPSVLRRYERWRPELVRENGRWALKFTLEALRLFYLQHLLLHELGHLVDLARRRSSKANTRSLESFADQYAIQWSPLVQEIARPQPNR